MFELWGGGGGNQTIKKSLFLYSTALLKKSLQKRCTVCTLWKHNCKNAILFALCGNRIAKCYTVSNLWILHCQSTVLCALFEQEKQMRCTVYTSWPGSPKVCRSDNVNRSAEFLPGPPEACF